MGGTGLPVIEAGFSENREKKLTSFGWFLLGTENILESSMNADTWLFDESASYVIFAF